MQARKACVVIFAIVLVVACLPAMAARTTVQPIGHPIGLVYQAYPGDSEETDLAFLGYDGLGCDVITGVPGVLSIDPGENWCRFVGAAKANSLGGLWNAYYSNGLNFQIKNIILQKCTPSFLQCSEVYAPKTITQQGTTQIRTWWPLMYEAPGTIWTLTILYGTPQLRVGTRIYDYDDDGTGLNPMSSVHQEVWQWKVDVTWKSLEALLALFHEVPFGLDEVPLISDDCLYPWILERISAIDYYLCKKAVDGGPDVTTASLVLSYFELDVQDACISSSPNLPFPSGAGTGIAQTEENPACCKLLIDAEYLAKKYGLFVSTKQ